VEPVQEPASPPPEVFVWLPARHRPKFQDRRWVHALLLLLTIASTTLVGMSHYASFNSDFLAQPVGVPFAKLVAGGLWYSSTILAILGCHELGHYLTCRYYDVDASLPYFIPVPILMSGTLGAFIHIREPIPSKRTLFDIGVAGPIAGFLVAVPALFLGLTMSHVVRIPSDVPLTELGEPLLLKLLSALIWGNQPDGYTLNLHPVAFAAWFGLLVTALNLFPFGQLDGGHVSYAVFGRASRYISIATVGAALVLTSFSISWIAWTGLMVVALFRFGPNHPPTIDEEQPLDRARLTVAVFALIIFVLCFTPAPIGATELLQR
jgi:membrane-associated protease RseP (regulator of RpoE activity)